MVSVAAVVSAPRKQQLNPRNTNQIKRIRNAASEPTKLVGEMRIALESEGRAPYEPPQLRPYPESPVSKTFNLSI